MRIIQKYGGTSVADLERLETVALTIKRHLDAGHEIIVVVSAMAGFTNQLVSYTKPFETGSHYEEYDTVISTGEQITTGLLALALQKLGIKSRSFMGWQIPIETTKIHGNAKITKINPEKLDQCLKEGITPIVAGFQGITPENRITTLGRGGSDTTAVALAVALEADQCDIYTDVDGIYTADPRLLPQAKKLTSIPYPEMLELAQQGAKVLHSPCVELASSHSIPLRVLSSFQDTCGTQIGGVNSIETRVLAITNSSDWASLNFLSPQIINFQGLFELLSHCDFDIGERKVSDPPFSLGILVSLLPLCVEILEKKYPDLLEKISIEAPMDKLSLVGQYLSDPEFLESVIVLTNSYDAKVVHISPRRLSFLVNRNKSLDLLGILHENFCILTP